MEYQKFIPEGWQITNEEITKDTLKAAMQAGTVMQGIVSKCDENNNLHIDLGKNIKGIIPKSEVETSEIVKESIYKNKENTYIQFKVREIKDDGVVTLSRKAVKEEALDWVTKDLNSGDVVCGIVKNIRPFGAFVEIGGGIVRTLTY